MTDRPIIFSAPMVRALLDGRKTMTRRIVTPQNCEFGSIPGGKLTKLYWQHADWLKAWRDGNREYGYLHVPCHMQDDESCSICFERGWDTTTHRLYPKTKIGDRFFVRENIWQAASYPGTLPSGEPEPQSWCWGKLAHYDADGEPPNTPNRHYPSGLRNGAFSAPDPYANWIKRSCIHMPRWASRITLIVTTVKIQRLQDISAEDAIAEGLYWVSPTHGVKGIASTWHEDPRVSFAELFKSINGAEIWDQNPWVVATSFRVHNENIDAIPRAEAA